MTATNRAFSHLLFTPRGILILLGFLAFWFPAFESRYFPVVSPLLIAPMAAVDGGTMIEGGEAEKLRDCDWRKTVFSLGDREKGRGVELTSEPHLDPPTERLPGLLRWEHIFLPARPDQVRDRAYGDAYHFCYPWLTKYTPFPEYWTRSEFY